MHQDNVKDKIRMLVEQLIRGTENGKVAWTDTVDPDAFRASMQGGMVRVQRRPRLDEEEHEVVDYSLTLLDRRGRELEEYYPEPVSPENELVRLWNLARRSARGTGEILDELLKETASGEGN